MAISLKQKKLPVHALKHSRYVFSTAKVCSDKQKTRSVEKIEKFGPCTQGACVRAHFEIVIDFSFQLA